MLHLYRFTGQYVFDMNYDYLLNLDMQQDIKAGHSVKWKVFETEIIKKVSQILHSFI